MLGCDNGLTVGHGCTAVLHHLRYSQYGAALFPLTRLSSRFLSMSTAGKTSLLFFCYKL